MPKKITVLLVDDHSPHRSGFRRMLDQVNVEVVGEACNGEEAVKLLNELRPQLVVIDCVWPRTNGLRSTLQILEDSPHSAALVLSAHYDSPWVKREIAAESKRSILNDTMDLELGGAIRKVVANDKVFENIAGRRVLKSNRASGLSPRELEVLQMIVDGKSNKQIAVELDLSANTVAVHRANIMNTLGTHKTSELVVHAIRAGLVSVP